MSRVYDALRRAEQHRGERTESWDRDGRSFQVVCVAANKGGVGKTTIATNLAVVVRRLRPELPVLIFGFDDQTAIDGLFGADDARPTRSMVEAMRAGSFRGALRAGRHGVHYVPSAANVSDLKRELDDPFALRGVLQATGWKGLVIVDTKSDLEILTRNALAAADLALVLVKDQPSLEQADRVFELLAAWGRPPDCARVLLSLVDLRVKYREGDERDILALLIAEIRRRGHPLLQSFVSRSARVESLHTNPERRITSVAEGAPGSVVDRQLQHVASEVLAALERRRQQAPVPPAQGATLRRVEASGLLDVRRWLLRSRSGGTGPWDS